MRWRCFRVTYELRSPLHIGYHKIGNVQRTRCYIPARTIWGAVTARLVRSGFSTPNTPEGDYRKIGDLLKSSCAFSYFFLYEDDTLLYPRYGEKGLYYGGFTQYELERRYLDAHVTTALDAATGSAETGSLHEVEYIAAHHQQENKNQGVRTLVRGWVFLNEEAMSYLGPGKWEEWLGELQVGGERRYGFGRLVLAEGMKESSDGWPSGYEFQLEGERPRFVIAPGAALLAHTLARGVKAKGAIEPLVGRETTDDGFGRNLRPVGICWVPGSVLDEKAVLSIDPEGYWKKDEDERL